MGLSTGGEVGRFAGLVLGMRGLGGRGVQSILGYVSFLLHFISVDGARVGGRAVGGRLGLINNLKISPRSWRLLGSSDCVLTIESHSALVQTSSVGRGWPPLKVARMAT
jgi:hypothetical protein